MKKVLVQTVISRIPDFFTHPLRSNRKKLKERGYEVDLFTSLKPDRPADIICLCSKTFSRMWGGQDEEIFSTIEQLKKCAGKIIWCDDSDSTGITHFELFPLIDLYLKKQLLVDKEKYCTERYYGDRIFTDFYHREFGIEDPGDPYHSKPLERDFLDRVQLSWHIGLGDMRGDILPRPINWLRRRLPPTYEIRFSDPSIDREIGFSFRGSGRYKRPTVSFHREQVGERLDQMRDFGSSYQGRLSIRDYRKEMEQSKMVVSPFGWGEIGVRDFESWIHGTALVKPDMSHMATWPDLFVSGETYQPIKWDFSDLESAIENLMHDQGYRLKLAEEGQDRYRRSISPEGMDQFCDWFTQQIEL